MRRSLGPNVNIVQINIDGISQSKSEYLSRLARDYEVHVLLIQETHTRDESDLAIRGNISGFRLVGTIYHRQYGSATYIREDIHDCLLISTSTDADIHTIVIEIGKINIMNVYKPPNATWPVPPLQLLNKPAAYIGDFNSHHPCWGYQHCNQNGDDLMDWSINQNLHLVFDAKDKNTFQSARWNRGYNPDLCFVSENDKGQPIPVKRQVLTKLPRSQHRPVFYHIGLQIDLFDSIPKPRWNFQKASWIEFTKHLDANIRFIPPEVSNYERFVKMIKSTAKKHIPRGFRKEYIPCWSNETSELYKKFQISEDPEVADELIQSLNHGRKILWEKTVESINFSRSSRKAWSVMRRLGEVYTPKKCAPKLNANLVASHVIKMSKVQMEVNMTKKIKKK